MKLLSIQVGRIREVPAGRRVVSTGIFKAPVQGPVLVRTLNLDGDEQADLQVHGGRDKAVYAYGADAHAVWQKARPADLFGPGGMGENLTFEALDEQQMFIGDVFQLGEVRLQVTQPRMPCYKLGIKYRDPKIVPQFMNMKRPGVYFRVLEEGLISAGQSLELIETEAVRASVAELFSYIETRPVDLDRVRDILSIRALPDYWREGLSGILSN